MTTLEIAGIVYLGLGIIYCIVFVHIYLKSDWSRSVDRLNFDRVAASLAALCFVLWPAFIIAALLAMYKARKGPKA